MPIVNGVNKAYEDLTEEDLNNLIYQSHPGFNCTQNDIVEWITKNEDIRILRLMALEAKNVSSQKGT